MTKAMNMVMTKTKIVTKETVNDEGDEYGDGEDESGYE
jgi:hypothetical protein